MSTANQPATAASTTITDIVRSFYEPFRTDVTSTDVDILGDDWMDVPLAPDQQEGPSGMAGQIAVFRHARPDYVTYEDIPTVPPRKTHV